MAKQDDLVENTPLGPVARRPKPTLTTGIDELVTGVNQLRKNFASEQTVNRPSMMTSILSGGGVKGALPLPGTQRTTGGMDDAGLSTSPTAAPAAGGGNDFSSLGPMDPNKFDFEYSTSDAAANAQRNFASNTPPPSGGYSPAGSRRMASDFADPRLVSPNVLAYQRAQQNSGPFNISDPTGSPVVTQRGRVEGSYGTLGGTPLTANYDRAGEAALVQQRRADTARLIEGGRGDRREANLRRRANARLSGDMGIVDFVVAAAGRKNAQAELTQLIGEKGKDRRAQLTADTSMRNTDVTQQGALQRSLISEQGDTQRAQAAQRATAALEQYKQGQSNFRTTLKEIASTDRKQMDINSKKFLAEFKSNDEFLQRSAEELGMTGPGLRNIIAQGIIPILNQERAESGQPPLDSSNIAALPPTDLVSAVAAAGQFDRRVASSQDWLGDPAVSPQEALDLATTNAYSVRLPRGKDKSGQTR